MFVISLATILFFHFFEVDLPEITLLFFAWVSVITIFLEGEVSLITKFSYARYVILTEKYEYEALKHVLNVRALSALIGTFALIYFGIVYIFSLDLDCVSLGVFVLNACSYIKYLNAEYFLKHGYVR